MRANSFAESDGFVERLGFVDASAECLLEVFEALELTGARRVEERLGLFELILHLVYLATRLVQTLQLDLQMHHSH